MLSTIKQDNHILINQKVYYKDFHKCVYLYGYKISKEWVWFLLKKKIKNLNYIFSTGMYSAFKNPHCGFLRLARRGYMFSLNYSLLTKFNYYQNPQIKFPHPFCFLLECKFDIPQLHQADRFASTFTTDVWVPKKMRSSNPINESERMLASHILNSCQPDRLTDEHIVIWNRELCVHLPCPRMSVYASP